MSTITNAIAKPHLSVKVQTIAALIAIISTVAIPQLFHTIGAVSGIGTALGEVFLPMHLPIIIVGLIAGPYAGAIAGLLGPLASYLMTGMPGSIILPFIMIELCAYGAFSGLLRNTKMHNISKVLITQIAGRAVRAVSILAAIYLLSNESVKLPVIWNSILTGVPGLVLQWSFIPLLMYRIENIKKNEQ